jgi:GLPGLI family protein
MKTYYLILSILILSIDSYCQNLEAVYSVRDKRIESFEKPNLMTQEQYDYLLDQIANARSKYKLSIQNNKSEYKFIGSFDKSGKQLQSTNTRKPYFKDFIQNRLLIETGRKNTVVSEDLKTINNWVLIEKDTIINHLQCSLAKHQIDKDVTAWYAKDIPVSDGPKHYSGLPGLIVALYTDSDEIILDEVTNLETLNDFILPKIDKTITLREYLNSRKKATPPK